MSTNPAKSPWYFVGFQELQLHFHPLIAVVVIPVLAALALLAIPYLRYPQSLTGPWFLSESGRRTGRLAAVAALVVTPLLIVVDEFLLQPGAGLPSLVWRGVVPLLVLGAAVAAIQASPHQPLRGFEIGGRPGTVHPLLCGVRRSDDHRCLVPRPGNGPGLAVGVVR